MHCVVWYASARTIARGKTRPNEFSAQSRHASEYLVRRFIREKGSSDKALRVSSDYDVARVYMNILASNSKRQYPGFLSFFLSLLAAFY
jgi:hypothetical protein